ncbi:MAG: TonB-dependent receptor [Alphaproteobacteria bacterium]|nr:TonB-dependent receptor [Alphaproteobacteria bacterium]
MLLGAATAAAVSLSGVAFAQQANVETVVVTGSHIASPNLQSASPVIEATANDIKVQGVTKIEDLLNQMPQVFAGQNATVSNGASGTSEVDLRGLGCDRTLVLIDGRRMPYGSMLDTCADLNQIPTQLVDRVEVLTGGASAVYGSDAISGVVNFITKQDFEGFQADLQYGTYQNNNAYDGPGNLRAVIAGRALTNPSQFKLPNSDVWDGAGKQLSAMMGVSSANGKGNVTAYFTYRQNDKIMEANRDYSACSLGGQSGTNYTCGGSSTSYPGRFTDFSTFNYTVNSVTGNTFRNFSSATDQYNYGPLNYYQRPDERYSAGAFGHYQAASYADFYTQIMYTDYATIAQIAPSGDFGNTNTINCGNPELSAQESAAIGCTAAMIATNANTPMYILRRNVEGGGRQSTLRNTSFRAILGVKGDFGPGEENWTYDLTGSYSRVQSQQIYLHDFSVTRLTRALDVVNVAGVPTCQSVVDGTDPNCVPWNIFSIGGVTAAAVNYLQVPLIELGSTTQLSVTAGFTGDLTRYGWVSPWAKDGVQIAFGAEYRQDALQSVSDTEFSTGDGAGQGGPTIGLSGATHVSEGYGEMKIPVAQDQDLAKSMSLDLTYRYSAYDRITTNTYGASGDWAPTDDIRFRGSYERAVRAPNVVDMFTPQGFNLTSDFTIDPCGAGGYATLAACQSTPGAGAAPWYGSAGLNSPAAQYNFLQGGNPGLSAEKADTFTVGFVATPTFIPGFNFSVDYYDMKVHGTIGTEGTANILYSCYTNHVAADCAKIHRTAGGLLWLGGGFIDNRNTNIGGVRTSGVDFNGSYQFDLADAGLADAGQIGLSLNGTWLNQLTTNTGVGIINRCAGHYGDVCGTPNPQWRHVFRINWDTPWDDLIVTGTWRFYGGVERLSSTAASLDHVFPAQSYFDLSAAMPVMTGATVRVGVNNILDTDPPISPFVGTTGNGNTYPQTYDAFGRFLFADLTINL